MLRIYGFSFGQSKRRGNTVLHYFLKSRLINQSQAQASLHPFAALGASIHRVEDTKEFQLLVPIRRPQSRNALLKQLTRQSFGVEWALVDVVSFIDGPQFVEVSETEADKIVKAARSEPENEPTTAYVDERS